MPLKRFICPDGEQIDTELCLSHNGCRMDRRCMLWALLKEVSRQRVWTGKPSTTQLLKGTCQAYLELTEDYAVKPSDEMYKILGTKIHSRLETEGHNQITEERLEWEGITGIIDVLYEEDGQQVLADYKVSGSFPIARALGLKSKSIRSKTEKYKRKTTSGGRVYLAGEYKVEKEWYRDKESVDFGTWREQINFYRVMLEHVGFKIDRMVVQAIVRDGGTRAAVQYGVFGKSYLIDIPKINDLEIISYFKHKRDALLSALETKKTPAPCSAGESWGGRKCESFCSVSKFCKGGS